LGPGIGAGAAWAPPARRSAGRRSRGRALGARSEHTPKCADSSCQESLIAEGWLHSRRALAPGCRVGDDDQGIGQYALAGCVIPRRCPGATGRTEAAGEPFDDLPPERRTTDPRLSIAETSTRARQRYYERNEAQLAGGDVRNGGLTRATIPGPLAVRVAGSNHLSE